MWMVVSRSVIQTVIMAGGRVCLTWLMMASHGRPPGLALALAQERRGRQARAAAAQPVEPGTLAVRQRQATGRGRTGNVVKDKKTDRNRLQAAHSSLGRDVERAMVLFLVAVVHHIKAQDQDWNLVSQSLEDHHHGAGSTECE